MCTAIVAFNFSSCKYEEGPKISLKSKTKRLTGDWDVKTLQGEPVAAEVTDYIFTFEEDGDCSVYKKLVDDGITYESTAKGDWEWSDDKKTLYIEYDQSTTGDTFNLLRLAKDEINATDVDGKLWEFRK